MLLRGDQARVYVYGKLSETHHINKKTRLGFLRDTFFPEIWEAGTLLVSWDLALEIPMLATDTTVYSKGKMKDWFEYTLLDFKPHILQKPIDSEKSFWQFNYYYGGQWNKDGTFHRGRFLDLRTLIFSLTDEYPQDEPTTIDDLWTLYSQWKSEFDLHPIKDWKGDPLEAHRAISPASIGKGYLAAMGVKNNVQSIPNEVSGYAMQSYYGGLSLINNRFNLMKCYYTDILSMFPSCYVLQGLWKWVTAKKIEVVEAIPEETKSFIETITLDILFNRKTWIDISGLVLVKPDGHLLPTRAPFDQNSDQVAYQIGLTYLTTKEPIWYTLSDVIACFILTGRIPEIIRSLKFKPMGKQAHLQKIMFRGEVEIDPKKDDPYKIMIEKRQTVKGTPLDRALKTTANSTAYGTGIELRREHMGKDTTVDVWASEHLGTFTNGDFDTFEKQGRYYNPLIATMITSAARLILAMMRRSVTDAGGDWAFMDTDSMAIIDPIGSKPEIIGQNLVKRFESLNPYSFGGSMLKAEPENFDEDGNYQDLYYFGISEKRYCLYNPIEDDHGNVTDADIRKKTDHGLGFEFPFDKNQCITEIWKYILAKQYPHMIKDMPKWATKYPVHAITRISNPYLYKLFNKRVKAGSAITVVYPDHNIIQSTTVSEYHCKLHEHFRRNHCDEKYNCDHGDTCLANNHMYIVSHHKGDLSNWIKMDWIEVNTGCSVQLILSTDMVSMYKTDKITVRNYKDVIKNYDRHGSNKSDDINGNPCDEHTTGLLQHPHVIADKRIKLIGKESNTIQSLDDEDILPIKGETLRHYRDKRTRKQRRHDKYIQEWESVLPIVKDKIKDSRLGISKSYVSELLSGKKIPSPELFLILIKSFDLPIKSLPEAGLHQLAQFENNPIKVRLMSDIIHAGVNMDEFNHLFSNHFEEMYNEKYVRMAPAVEEYLLIHNKNVRINRKKNKINALEKINTMEIKGNDLFNHGKEIILTLSDINEYQVYHKAGISVIHVKTFNKECVHISVKKYPLLFDAKILPKPVAFFNQEKKKKKITLRGDKEYTKWFKFVIN